MLYIQLQTYIQCECVCMGVCVCPRVCTCVLEPSEAHTGNIVNTETLVASVVAGRTGPPHLALTP